MNIRSDYEYRPLYTCISLLGNTTQYCIVQWFGVSKIYLCVYSFIHWKEIKFMETVMDSTRHYENHFEDYSISVSHNIIENNSTMVYNF